MRSKVAVKVYLLVALFAMGMLCCAVGAADWPHWRGPDYNGISKETAFNPAALNENTKPVWEAEIGMGFSSVTVSNGKAYAMGNVARKTDIVYCFDADTGKQIWTHSYPEPLDPKYYEGGTSATPTVAGGKVYTISKKGKIFCLDAATGKELWRVEWETKHNVNASDPVISGDYIFIASGYNRGCGLIKLNGDSPTKLWDTKNMRSQLSGPVLIDGYLYGIDENQLVCMDFMTGDVKWKEPKIGKGSLMAADGKLIVLSDKGTLYIAPVSPRAFVSISSAKILSGKCWTMPVLANGNIYARSSKGHLVCIDISAKTAMVSLPASTPPDDSGSSDWPQFRGPNRDGKSAETGLLKKWPEAGPKMLWSVDGLGSGYSTVAIANGAIYTTGMVKSKGVLFAFDTDGKPKWKKTYGPEWRRSMPGVRCTPTVDGDNIYVISGVGVVFCYDAKSGEQKWTVDAFSKFDGKYGIWGIAESPLIVDDKIICTPGGGKATMAALNKNTGETVWTCLVEGERSCYCSPILVERGPNKIIVTMTDEYVLGVDAKTGKLLWKDSQKDQFGHNKEINPVSPIHHNGRVYATSGYDDGGAMLQLNADGTAITRKWIDRTLDCHHGGVVLVDGHIYGANWDGNGDGSWVCLDWETGNVKYETHWNCKGAVTYADGMLYCYEEKRGNVALVKPDPAGFEIVSSFAVELGDGKHWAHPVVCNGTLYIRHGDVLMAYDISAG